jgi:hypothetical protein
MTEQGLAAKQGTVKPQVIVFVVGPEQKNGYGKILDAGGMV